MVISGNLRSFLKDYSCIHVSAAKSGHLVNMRGHVCGFSFDKDSMISFGMAEMKSFLRQCSIIFETKFNLIKVEQHPTKIKIILTN